MRADETPAKNVFKLTNRTRFDAANIRNDRLRRQKGCDFPREGSESSKRGAEHGDVCTFGRLFRFDKNLAKSRAQALSRFRRTRPEANVPLRPVFLNRERKRTADQPRAKNGDRAQGTRKILFV